MANNPRKKVTKIFEQIKKVAQKGKDNVLEYHKLIDNIVAKGDYAHLEMCLADHYKLNTAKYKTVQDIKSKTWKNILFETDANFITGLKRIYNANNLYQQGQEIRSDDNNYVMVNTAGNSQGPYPFIEKKIAMSEAWNKKFERTTYNQVATSSQISITKDTSTGTQSNGIQISILDEMIYQIDVTKVIWATYSITGTQSSYIIESPYELNMLNTIKATGTQSYLDKNAFYRTNIPMTHGADYLVTTYRRGNPGWLSKELTYEKYSYKVYIRKQNLLGTIKEVGNYDQNSNYLHLSSKFAELTGLKKTFLEVMKNGTTDPITIIYDNPSLSEERNLLERYKIAINYLNS